MSIIMEFRNLQNHIYRGHLNGIADSLLKNKLKILNSISNPDPVKRFLTKDW